MATVRDKWYTMPKGPDGKRHRVWHSIKDMLTLPQVVQNNSKKFIAALKRMNKKFDESLEFIVFGK